MCSSLLKRSREMIFVNHGEGSLDEARVLKCFSSVFGLEDRNRIFGLTGWNSAYTTYMPYSIPSMTMMMTRR